MKKYILAIAILSFLTTEQGWSKEGSAHVQFENGPKKKKTTKKVESQNTDYAYVDKENVSVEELGALLKEIDANEELDEINYLTEQLLNVANEYTGVRYRFGGTSKNGIDCSGLVTSAFKEFNISLPRSSRDMATVGDKVSKSDAQKGDLIFFKTRGSRISHVGIVTEVLDDEIKFIHSSTSKGVIISSTKEAYYHKTFAQINRVYDKKML